KADYDKDAKARFQEDLDLAKRLGVRGFPSLFFSNEKGETEFVYGAKPYAFYEVALLKLAPSAAKKEYDKTWEFLFSKYPTLTAKEFTELSGVSRKESERWLDESTAKGKLTKHSTKNGAIWKLAK